MPLPYRSPIDDEEKRKQAIERLPNWAKMYIARLESDNAHLRQERAETTGEDSPIWHTPDYRVKLYLPKRTSVVFKLEHGELEFRLREGLVYVNADGPGYPYVMPDATNSLTLGLKERFNE